MLIVQQGNSNPTARKSKKNRNGTRITTRSVLQMRFLSSFYLLLTVATILICNDLFLVSHLVLNHCGGALPVSTSTKMLSNNPNLLRRHALANPIREDEQESNANTTFNGLSMRMHRDTKHDDSNEKKKNKRRTRRNNKWCICSCHQYCSFQQQSK